MTETGRWSDLRHDGRIARFALLCLGIWLNAADALVTSTIMPSVAREIGGYAFFAWPVTAYLLGAIVAGASAGRLVEIAGLRSALCGAALLYAIGCAVGALAPSMGVFLVSRLLQGTGAGWIVGLVYGAVSTGFPKALWSRVLASVSGVWGIATLLGPLIGGLFAGSWRMLFWAFGAQALAFAAASLALVPPTHNTDASRGLPFGRLALLAVSVLAVGMAGIMGSAPVAIALLILGTGLLVVFIRRDARASVNLLPPQLVNIRSVSGTGYLMIFLASAASVGFAIYGTALLQRLYGLTPLEAGYGIGAEALGWTLLALAVAPAPQRMHGFFIRAGATCVLAAIALLGIAIPSGNLAFAIGCGFLLGAGFGLFWSFAAQRIFESLHDDERRLGSSAVPATQTFGGTFGSAISGTIANLLGMTHALDIATAQSIGTWLFVSMIPLAFAAWLCAWRLASGKV